MNLELSYIQNTHQRQAWPQREGEKVRLLLFILVTADTSQSPITPYGLPVPGTFEAAKDGQDPSAVSPKHPPVQKPLEVQVPTAAFKAALFPGANTARTTSAINNVAAKQTHNIKVHERRPPVRVFPRLVALSTDAIL